MQIDLTFNLLSEDVWGIYDFTRRYHGKRPSTSMSTQFIRSAMVIMFLLTPIVTCAINVPRLSNYSNQLAHIDVKSRGLELMSLTAIRSDAAVT